MMTEKEFFKYARQGNLVPVFQEIDGDLETPVAAYMKLAAGQTYSFLLESVEGGERLARYSFLARAPEAVVTVKGREAKVLRPAKQGFKAEKRHFVHSPLELLRELISGYKFVTISGLPLFCGGLVGYLGYDTVRFFEKLPDTAKDDPEFPDMVFMLAKDVVVFDHLYHTIKVVSCVDIPAGATQKHLSLLYRKALGRIRATARDLEKPLPQRPKSAGVVKLKVRSNCTRRKYEAMVEAAKEDIRAGEIIQAVLSQRFETDIKAGAVAVYRTLRALNPSPYMYLLNLDGFNIVGSSPELLVRVEKGNVATRPIAGTRPRGKTPGEDLLLEQELLADPKELAEHVMLVDLGRNDLGRVCETGSVKVTELMKVEKYSHVMHIVSNVEGRLNKDMDALAALQAVFPAGTLSGAPKIRAMEIIESLEPTKRGPYGGCVGYISFTHDLDTCITIRTVVIKGKKAYVQAGAGIVADSDPGREYEETVNKAKAQLRALELAHQR